MTYQEALQYLNSFIDYEKIDTYDYRASLRLDRMKRFASILGDPQEGIRSLHVAGTKGKGSTAAIIYSILKSARFKVGLYTSPHLISFRERIRINDELISEEDICRLLENIKDAVEQLGEERPSFFEVYTALAYLYFKEKKVDFAVYEVGLGGRLDATNIIKPLVCAITPISYEHTQKLGSTLREIAYEKCGIIKKNTICVSAPQEKEALSVIETVCKENDARLIRVGRDILFEELRSSEHVESFSVWGTFGEYPILETKLLGSHQMVNAACAIGVTEALRFYGITITPDAVRNGLAEARWHGRLHIIQKRPFVVLDGAQNRASAHALAQAVKKIFTYKRLLLVFGASKDKDIIGMLEEFIPITDNLIITKSKMAERALEPSHINDMLNHTSCVDAFRMRKDNTVFLTASTEEALSAALGQAQPEDLILVTGSLFIVGEVMLYMSEKGPVKKEQHTYA